MEFIQLLNLTEKLLTNKSYELLELNYSRVTFGSGFIDYKIRSKYIRIVLDGKEKVIEVLITNNYTQYKSGELKSIYRGSIKNVKEDIPRILSNIYQPTIL